MKTIISIIAIIAILYGGWWLYSNSAPEEPATQGAGEEMTAGEQSAVVSGTYVVVPAESVIRWEAGKPLIEGYVHRGTIGLSGGTIEVEEASASGTFDLDMNTISVTSLGGGKEGSESKLESHLKRSDFFDVDTHPTGMFTIASVEPIDAAANEYRVLGTLTLKDNTEPVEFPATIYLEDGMLRAKAVLSIDRTRWGISFGSKSISDAIGENAISDTVQLELDIAAQAEQ